ncbi:MAG: helix-turn-helix domain-containing protein [Oscillospiraceae bacterium]|nr:helix-turn-helix domain-containing protein [Oscillospiraceae bacterium]
MTAGLFSDPIRRIPDLQMIIDDLEGRYGDFSAVCPGEAPRFRSIQIYSGQAVLREDVLYILGETAEGFPVDSHPYVASGRIDGAAPHVSGLGVEKTDLINELLFIFQRYQDFVLELNSIAGSGDLNDLCRAGGEFLNNPMYIHDSGFTVLAMPDHVPGMMEMDFNPRSERYYIPLWLVEEFKLNDDYLATLPLRRAAIWGKDQYPYNLRSLFVNIWDGNHYRGRLLVNELTSDLRRGQFRIAELIAEYALQIIRRDEQNRNRHYRDSEDTFKALIEDREVEETDLQMVLSVMGWKENDRFVLTVLQSQDERLAVASERTVQNQLFATFPGSFSFFYDQRLCVIVDLTQMGMAFPVIRSRFAPILRDSLLYGGASFPIDDLADLPDAYRQAIFALGQSFRQSQSKWLLTFEDCAVTFLLNQTGPRFPPDKIASPALQFLRAFDREKGTDYYNTLRCYLQCERSIPRASEKLIIHRSTLEYRMEKIQDLIHLDLEDRDIRLYLLLSFRLIDEMQGRK